MAEGRGPTKGNAGQQNASRTQSRTEHVCSALGRVRQTAERDRKVQFTSFCHHVTVERLRASFHALTRKAAAGVDGGDVGAVPGGT